MMWQLLQLQVRDHMQLMQLRRKAANMYVSFGRRKYTNHGKRYVYMWTRANWVQYVLVLGGLPWVFLPNLGFIKLV